MFLATGVFRVERQMVSSLHTSSMINPSQQFVVVNWGRMNPKLLLRDMANSARFVPADSGPRDESR